jgi:uncharacterized iron-regulated membrane protein
MTVDEKFLIRKRKKAHTIRLFRKIHRQTAVFLFIAFFIMAGTGLLLGWKKNSGGLILAKTEKGTSTDLSEWLPLNDLQSRAILFLHDSVNSILSSEIDRIDVRPDKGIVKIIFANHYTGLQVDGVTGKILKTEQRRADLIEHIHDGTIVDRWLNLSNGMFKLIYTTTMGLALLLFTVIGFWLWWGPKQLHKMKEKKGRFSENNNRYK